MPTVTLAEAQAKLAELVDHLAPGEELVITRDDKPVAKLTPVEPPAPAKPRSGFGAGKGMLDIISDDDEHLKDFAEYM